MKSVSLSEIKAELEKANRDALVTYCLRLSKFKKENKELMVFLLFDSDDPSGFTERVKEEMDIWFGEINLSNVYYVKKSLRKIARYLNKYLRIAGSKIIEAELSMEFYIQLNRLPPSILGHKQVIKIQDSYRAKIESALASLHPDLQYDLRKQLEKI